MKRFITTIVKLVLIIAAIPLFALQISAAEGYGYDPDAALSYAQEHWDDGVGVCDEFVKACLLAGGVEVNAGGVEQVMTALLDAGYASGYCELTVDEQTNYINESDNVGLVSPGDVLFFKCVDCAFFTHTVMISGYDQDGHLMAYGHNPAWNNYLYHGTIYHKLGDGTQHDNFEFYAVNMSTEDPGHQHKLTRDLYESEHPHLMYDKCGVEGCKLKYYLGWNATVKSCHICNPSPNGKPVVSLDINSDGGVEVAWTALPDVAEYQVWRSQRETGTYFKISTTHGAYITNSSSAVTAGLTYYYKVIAVLENNTEVASDVASIKVPGELSKPVITASNNAAGEVILSWSDVPGAQGYQVYRATSVTGQFAKWQEKGPNDTNYTDSSVAAGGTYYYKVTALFGETTTESNVVSITCPNKELTVTLSINDAGKVKASWPAMADVVEYQVWRSKYSTGTYTKILSLTGTSMTNSSVTPGVTYYYKVVAIKSDDSELSSPVDKITVPGELGKAEVQLSLNTAGAVVVSWTAVDGADGYRVYRSDSQNGPFVKKIETSATTGSYTNTDVSAGNTYYYVVEALIGEVTTESEVVSISCPAAEQLAAPTITVTNRASDGKPTISWSKVDGATGYEVYRADSSGGTYKLLYTAKDPNKLSVTHTGAAVGNDYFYKVRALNGDVQGKFSSAKGVWCDLARPTITVSNRASDGKPVISWSKVTGATGYEVYRADSSGGTYKLLYTAKDPNKLSVTHTGAVAGNDYFYKVKAIYGDNSKCNSALSSAKGVWCDLARPTVTVSNRASDGKPVISWSKVTGATGYEVYRADSSGGTYKLLYTAKDPNKLSVTHTGAVAGNDYFYKVKAIYGDNSKCNSALSSAKGVWCDLKRPTLTVTLNSNGKPYLKWSEVTGADSYKVYRSTDGESWSLIYTAKGNDFDVTHTGAKSGVTYKYKVIAIDKENSKCNSAYSQVKTITCR